MNFIFRKVLRQCYCNFNQKKCISQAFWKPVGWLFDNSNIWCTKILLCCYLFNKFKTIYPSNRNHLINLHCKSVDWFQYEGKKLAFSGVTFEGRIQNPVKHLRYGPLTFFVKSSNSDVSQGSESNSGIPNKPSLSWQ